MHITISGHVFKSLQIHSSLASFFLQVQEQVKHGDRASSDPIQPASGDAFELFQHLNDSGDTTAEETLAHEQTAASDSDDYPLTIKRTRHQTSPTVAGGLAATSALGAAGGVAAASSALGAAAGGLPTASSALGAACGLAAGAASGLAAPATGGVRADSLGVEPVCKDPPSGKTPRVSSRLSVAASKGPKTADKKCLEKKLRPVKSASGEHDEEYVPLPTDVYMSEDAGQWTEDGIPTPGNNEYAGVPGMQASSH
jgi:hypothetical protein